jgi:hypothetical protein
LVSDVAFGQIDTLVPNNGSDELNIDIGITRNRNKYLWPLIYREKTETSYDLQLMFTLYRNHQIFDVAYQHQHLLPLYWYTKSAGVTTLKLATTYYPSLINFERDSAAGITKFKLGSLMPNIDLLNVSRSKNGLFVENNFFFFIFSKNDSIARKSHLVVFPLYWHYENNKFTKIGFTEKLRTTSFFPIYSYKKDISFNPNDDYMGATSDQRNWVFYPMLTKVTKFVRFGGLKSGDTLKTFENGFSSFFLLYHSSNLKKIKKLGSTSFNVLNGERKWVLFPVLFYKKRYDTDGYLKLRFTVFPIVFRKYEFVIERYKAKKILDNNLVVFPVYWKYQDDYSRTLAIIPFRYHEQNRLDTSDYYFPNIWVSKSPNEKSIQVYPLYFYKYSKFHQYNVLFPFYYSAQRKGLEENTKITSVAFWYWHTKIVYANNSQTNHYSFLPFYYRETYLNGIKKSSTTMITPIYWKVKSVAGWSSHLLLPIYWRSVSYTDTSLLLLPFYYSQKSVSENLKVYFPFVWSYQLNDTRKLFLFPMVYRMKSDDKHAVAIFPFYFKYDDLKRKDRIYSWFFIYWNRKIESQKRLTSDGVKPLVWGLERQSLIPLYYYEAAEMGDTTLMLTPIFWNVKNQKYHSTYLFPLFSSYSDKRVKKWSLFPLAWYEKNAFDTTLLVMPLYYSQRSSYSNVLWISPLFYREKGQFDNHLVVFPFYWRFNEPHEKFKFVFPVYLAKTNLKDTFKMITPFYFERKKNDFQLRRWALIFYQKIEIERNWYKDKIGVVQSVGVPLLFKFKKFNDDSIRHNPMNLSEYTHYQVELTPLIQWKTKLRKYDNYTYSNAYNQKGIFKNSTEHRFRIAPFIYYSRSIDQFYHIQETKPENHLRLSEYEKYIYKDRFKNQSTYLISKVGSPGIVSKLTIFPIYYSLNIKPFDSFDNCSSRRVVFPFFWHYSSVYNNHYLASEHNHTRSNKTYLLPFFGKYSYDKIQYKYETSDKNRRFKINYDSITHSFYGDKLGKVIQVVHYKKDVLSITPIFWHIKRLNGIHHLLFPFYSYSKVNQNFTSTILFNDSLSIQKKSLVDSFSVKAHILYLLYRYESSDSLRSHSVFWPIVSYEKQKQTTRFRIAPLFWYKNAPNHTFQYLFPLYGYRHKDSLKVFQMLLNTYRFTSIEGHLRSHKFLFGMIQSDKYQNGDFETRICYKLYVNLLKDSSTEKTIFPIYGKVNHKNGNYRKNYFLGLYNKTKTKIPNTNESYIEEKLFWVFRYRSNIGYLKTKGITDKQVNQLTRFK